MKEKEAETEDEEEVEARQGRELEEGDIVKIKGTDRTDEVEEVWPEGAIVRLKKYGLFLLGQYDLEPVDDQQC